MCRCARNLVTPWHKMTEKEMDALLHVSLIFACHFLIRFSKQALSRYSKMAFQRKNCNTLIFTKRWCTKFTIHTAFSEILKWNFNFSTIIEFDYLSVCLKTLKSWNSHNFSTKKSSNRSEIYRTLIECKQTFTIFSPFLFFEFFL